MTELLSTTVMGSYPQPRWLVDHEILLEGGVARVARDGIWRVDPESRQEAIEAATLVAIADQETAGVEVITDGEIGRESYFNHFANALGGIDSRRLGLGRNRRGDPAELPLVSGPVQRLAPVELEAAGFLRAHTSHLTKVTVPGPFTLSQLAQNEYYPDQRSLAMAYAAAVNEELRDLEEVGIDVLQLDEPYLQADAELAREFAVEAIAAAVEGLSAVTTLHTCYGYAIFMEEKAGGYPFLGELAEAPVDSVAIESAQPDLDPIIITELSPRAVVLGVVDLGTSTVESAETIADRIRRALRYIDAADLSVAPDCGMKYLERDVAFRKLSTLVQGAAAVRAELTA